MMKRAAGQLVLFFLVVAGAAYCGGSAPLRRPLAQPFPPNADGERLYGKYCALCHGSEGEGYRADEAAALASQDFLTVATDDFIAANTRRGRPGTPMSAWGAEFGGALTTADAQAVVAHLRTWQTEAPIDVSDVVVDGDAGRGAEPYLRHCETCHGDQGQGATAMTLNNPVFQDTASDGFLRFTVANGRRGTKMKAFGDKLRRGELDDVVEFVKALPPAPTFAGLASNVGVAAAPVPGAELVINPGGPPAEFTLKDGRFVPADDIHAALVEGRSFVMIDARPYSDYLAFHIQGAASMPFYDVEKRLDELPRDLWIITYCGCPHAISGQALDALRAGGIDKSGVLDEGIYVWDERGYPVVGK